MPLILALLVWKLFLAIFEPIFGARPKMWGNELFELAESTVNEFLGLENVGIGTKNSIHLAWFGNYSHIAHFVHFCSLYANVFASKCVFFTTNSFPSKIHT